MSKINDEILKVDVIINGDDAQNELQKLTEKNRDLVDTQKELQKQKARLVAQGKKETQAYKDISEKLKENSKALRNNKEEQTKLRGRIGLTGLTTRQLAAEQRRLKRILSNTVPDTDAYRDYEAQLKKVNLRLKEIAKGSESSKDSVESFSEALSIIDPRLGSIASKGGEIFELMLNPVTALLAVLGGIVVGTKKWFDLNKEILRTRKIVKGLTGETGQLSDDIRIRAQVLQDAFGLELTESIETANSLVKNMGITFEEAFDVIEDGAIKGRLSNGEYLDSLKEYPIQFKNAGYSVREFASIVETGIDLSIYSDKLPDAIKEVDLALKDQSKGVRDALVGAFGATFTDSILKRIKVGKLTTKGALEEIGKAAKKQSLNQQQYAKLTADLFKGAGEDAGGAKKIFEALGKATESLKKPLTDIQKLNKKNLEVQRNLENVYRSVFKLGNDGMAKIIAQGELFISEFLLKVLLRGVDMINWIIDLNNESRVFSGLLSILGDLATSNFEVIGILLSNTWLSLKSIANLTKGIFTFDLDAIKQGLSQGVDVFTNVVDGLKEKAAKDANDIFDAFSGKNKFERITIKDFVTEEVKKSEPTGSQVAKTKTEKPKSKKNKIDDAKKAQDDLDKLLRKSQSDREIEQAKGLEKELARIDAKYREEILKAKKFGLDETNLLRTIEAEKIFATKEYDEELRRYKEELRLNDEILKAEAEGRQEEAELLKNELKFQKLFEEHEGEVQVLIELEESKRKAIQAINDKWDILDREKKVKEDKIELERKRNFQEKLFESSLSLFGRESKLGQAILATKQIFAAKESLIQLGVLKSKVASGVAEAQINTAVGVSATAKVGFPQNIPLLIGFAAQVAGIVGAIKGSIEAKKTIAPGYEKGKYPITRTDGKVFNSSISDDSGTQLVTEPTYFTDTNRLVGEYDPEIIIDGPTVKQLRPQVVDEIFSTASRVRGFEAGKFPGHETSSTPNESTVTDEENNNQSLFIQSIQRNNELLQSLLDNPIRAKLLFGYDDIEEFEELQKERNQSNNNGILAKG